MKKLQQALNSVRVRPLLFCGITGLWLAAICFIALVSKGFLVALILGVAFLAALESILRVLFQLAFGRDYRRVIVNYSIVDHPRYGYSLRPNLRSVSFDGALYDRFLYRPGEVPSYNAAEDRAKIASFSINSKGFRGAEFSERKAADTIRIFCSGGSTTAGNNVADNETWPAYLEEYLKKADKKVEVINAGVFGWYSLQELRRFQDELRRYQPDIVLLHQGWNEEFEYSSQSLGKKWRPGAVRNNLEANYFYTSNLKSALLKHSLVAFFLAQSIYKHLIFERQARFSNPDRWQMLRVSEYFSEWFSNLKAFSSGSEELKAKLFTVNYPCLARCMDPVADRKLYYTKTRLTPLFADYQALSKARITHFLNSLETKIPCLDGEGAFSALSGEERLKYFVDEIHLSALGNKLFAEAIGERLLVSDAFTGDGAKQRSGDVLEKLRDEALSVPAWIVRSIEQHQMYLTNETRKTRLEALEVPTDRYTTF